MQLHATSCAKGKGPNCTHSAKCLQAEPPLNFTVAPYRQNCAGFDQKCDYFHSKPQTVEPPKSAGLAKPLHNLVPVFARRARKCPCCHFPEDLRNDDEI